MHLLSFHHAAMDPPSLFPWLALAFFALGLAQWMRTRRWRGAAGTWLTLAVIFGAVTLWLRWHAASAP